MIYESYNYAIPQLPTSKKMQQNAKKQVRLTT